MCPGGVKLVSLGLNGRLGERCLESFRVRLDESAVKEDVCKHVTDYSNFLLKLSLTRNKGYTYNQKCSLEMDDVEPSI